MTNADKIRAKTDEQMAEWLNWLETAVRAFGIKGEKFWLDWLKQEVKE